MYGLPVVGSSLDGFAGLQFAVALQRLSSLFTIYFVLM